MSTFQDNPTAVPEEQLRIRAKCFHPSGAFVKFKKEDIEQSITDRFEKQVRIYPHRLAVKNRFHELTYKMLNQSANRIARAILEQRHNEAEPIALLVGQEPSAISSIFGVLKTGKFFVLCDPSHPHSRILYNLKDAQADLIITNNRHLSLANELAQHTIQVLNVDELGEGFSNENLDQSILPDSLSWISYTSGSTGQPKGVIQNHRNALHMIKNFTNLLHVCMDDRLSLIYSPSSVASIQIIFLSLLNGASVFPFDIKKNSLITFSDWLVIEKITIHTSVATLFRHLADTLKGRKISPKLRLIHVGGETIYPTDLKLYQNNFSKNCIFAVNLGATEISPICEYFVDQETRISDRAVPAGYVADGTIVILLNDEGAEVTFNNIGEIAVKSKYLALGYWRKPELSKQKFLSDPEGGDERIYLTGDLGRIQSDGCLSHIGRKDFQVKIRGHRVEIAEIEAALQGIDTVKESVVLARKNQIGEHILVAYLVAATKPAQTVSSLRQTLSEKLPDYMIPSHFVMLDTLPLNPNNKVDRKALPEPDDVRPELENPFISPRTPVEQTLTVIWSEVLNIKPVGINDKFLELGGNSLLATAIISRVLKTFQMKLSLQSLFAAQTIAEMAVLITQNQAEKADQKDLDRMLADLEKLSDKEVKEQTKSNKFD